MAEAAGLILSALGTGLSLISLITGNLQASGGTSSTSITVSCAQVAPDDRDASVSGKFDVRLFNQYAEEIGPPVVDQYVNTGNAHYVVDYKHSSEYDGNQSPYIKITGNDDAICIAWLTVTWPDGIDWVWPGDYGRRCGVTPWYYNDNILGDIKQGDGAGNPSRPDCTWIDGDGSVGGDTTAFSVYLPHFTTEKDGSHYSRDQLCSSPNIATYQNDDGAGLTYFSPPPQIGNNYNYDGRKRDAPGASESSPNLDPLSQLVPNIQPSKRLFTTNNTKLVESTREQHSAVDLCEADLSWGPSFVSHFENKFCDMSTKTLYDLCAPGSSSLGSSQCFDLDSLALRGLKSVTSFNWLSVERWGL